MPILIASLTAYTRATIEIDVTVYTHLLAGVQAKFYAVVQPPLHLFADQSTALKPSHLPRKPCWKCTGVK